MHTAQQTRHINLLRLIEECGSVQALADALGKSYAQISQLRNQIVHSQTGKPRTIGDDLAREIEVTLSKPIGWMDNSPTPSADGETLSPRAASLASRLDALSGDRQMRAFALVDLTLRTLEAEASMAASSTNTKRASRKA